MRKVLLGAGLPQNKPGAQGDARLSGRLQGLRVRPAAARRLLAEAGYANGVDTELWYATGYTSSVKELSEAVQGYLSAVGIRAKIVVNDLAAWAAARR